VSIEKRAVRGVAWNLATSLGARIVGLVGTLVLTRFIAPSDYGEVSAAAICVLSANQLTYFAFGQYLIAYKSPPRVVFQAAAIHTALGVLAMLAVFFLRRPLGIMLDAPEMGRFIPGYAFAIVLDRVRHIPERLLVRDLRFRTIAIVNSIGEVTFTCTALALAPRIGGYAIMFGAVARAVVTFFLFLAKAPRSEWLAPNPVEKGVARALFAYGTPIMVGAMADRAASTWDNLVMLRLFGSHLMGEYALSYSLAETPLIYVAERMGDVLMPAFSKMEPHERPAAVVRAAGLMSLVVAPLGVGLGAVAPTVVHAFFNAKWIEMGSILSVLSVMTVFQPTPWSAVAYLQAERMTRLIMIMSIARALAVLVLVAGLGWLGGPIWACGGVGLAYAVHAVVTVILIARVTPLSVRAYFVSVLRPLLACIPMFVAVRMLRALLDRTSSPLALSLTAEIFCGAIVYVVAAFLLASSNVRELVGIVRRR
jgi:PST family polysaccharide transporter